jgi:hypothetical protein
MREHPCFSAALLLSTALAGCGDGLSSSSSSGDLADVSGTFIDTHLTEAGESQRPIAPSTVTLSALVADGQGFTSHPGTLGEDGTFTVPGVPAGEYTLEIASPGSAPTFLVTTERALDLGAVRSGRFDAAAPTQPTVVTITASGLTPWQDADTLEVFSLGAGTWDGFGLLAFTGLLTAGTTSLAGFDVDSARWRTPALIEGSKGDRAVITHLTTRNTAGFLYKSIGEALTPPSFTQVDGQETALLGNFEATPQEHVALAVKRAALDQVAMEGNPKGMVTGHEIYFHAEPGGASRATGSSTPTLLVGTDSDSADGTLELDYGSPFPAGWATVASVGVTYTAFYTLPGASIPINVNGFAGVVAPIDDLAKGPVSPRLGAPQHLRIGGQDGFSAVTGVGLTPEIQWSAPALGAPDAYAISVRRLEADQPAQRVARIVTTRTSVVIPPGILSAGVSYVLVVTAKTGYDPARPNISGATYATADALSGLLMP